MRISAHFYWLAVRGCFRFSHCFSLRQVGPSLRHSRLFQADPNFMCRNIRENCLLRDLGIFCIQSSQSSSLLVSTVSMTFNGAIGHGLMSEIQPGFQPLSH
jgi:hypothetical protein